jgi:hypothetical protein
MTFRESISLMTVSNDVDLHMIAHLQSIMTDISEDRISEALAQVLDLPLVASASGIEHIASAILVAVYARPMRIPALAQLSMRLYRAASPANALDELRASLLKILLRCFTYSNTVPYEAASFAFLFHGVKHRLIPKKWVVTLARFCLAQPPLTRTSAWLLSYFAPELQQADPALYHMMTADFQANLRQSSIPHMFKSIGKDVRGERGACWRRLKMRRDFFANSDACCIATHVMHDDVAALEQKCQDPTFSIDTRVVLTPYIPTRMLGARPTLIQAAAFFGAVRCFRWLLSNGADLSLRDRNYKTLAEMAAAGGNLEIIRQCQQYGLDFHGAVHAAIRQHRHAIADWLLRDGGECDFAGEVPLHAACKANNIYALTRLPRADVNTRSGHLGRTPLRLAVRRGHAEAVAYLLSLPEIDVDDAEPLAVAAKYGLTPKAEAITRLSSPAVLAAP